MFLPKKSKVFDNLVKQSAMVKEAAQVFKDLAHHWDKRSKAYTDLDKIEHEADEFVHIITDEIERVFILPLDKEDIKELTDLLDDVIDNLEQAANRLKIYNITRQHPDLKDFADFIFKAVREIEQGISLIMRGKLGSKELAQCCHDLHDIENQADTLHRNVLEDLMGESPAKNFLYILKWKEIFQTLEDTLDVCEDIAVTFNRLKIKYR